jgi:hypothetical protein
VKGIIILAENRQNVQEDLTPEWRQGLDIHYVKTIREVAGHRTAALATRRRKMPKSAMRF